MSGGLRRLLSLLGCLAVCLAVGALLLVADRLGEARRCASLTPGTPAFAQYCAPR